VVRSEASGAGPGSIFGGASILINEGVMFPPKDSLL